MLFVVLCVFVRYWELKKEMASGSEPPHIKTVLHQFRDLCSGVSLCGAGAGGFAVLVLRQDVSREFLQQTVDAANRAASGRDWGKLTLHSVKIDPVGIVSHCVDCDPSSTTIERDLSQYLV